jgi:hypothetical protein
MKVPKAFVVSFAAIAFQLFNGCTESPFDSKIAPEPKQIEGRADLLDTADDRGIYIWLAGINQSAYTDSTGAFRLELPKNISNDLNGIFDLYFYVANYRFATASVVIRQGKFLYGAGDIAANGRVKEVVTLRKILDIKTIVEPATVVQNYAGPIHLQTTLQAAADSVSVVFPKSVGGLLGGMFFRHLRTGQIYIDIADIDARTRETVTVGREPVSRRQVFQLNGTNYRDLFLPVGEYIVIPFFLIRQDNLPQALVDSFGEKADDLTPNYLKIPFRRQDARFSIVQ